MLFETDQKKPAHINRNSLHNTMHKSGTSINKTLVKPVQRNSTATSNLALQYKLPVSTAGHNQVKRVPATALQKQKIYTGISSAPLKKTIVAPYYKTAIKKAVPLTRTGVLQPRKIYTYPVVKKPLQSTIGRLNYARSVKPIRAVTPQRIISRNTYRGPVVVRRGVHIPGRRMYYPGQRIMSPGYATGGAIRPANVNVTVNTPGGRYVPGYGYCVPRQAPVYIPPASTIQQSIPVATNSPVIKKPCHTCGLKTKGCTTLSRFAFNSSQLNAVHKKQIHEMALNIIHKNIHAIIATGHTDSSGKEDYNKALGARRAGAVVRELRKQLSVLKPNAHKNIFWKILTRGEAQPISKTDVAANRRVHICVRKMTAA